MSDPKRLCAFAAVLWLLVGCSGNRQDSAFERILRLEDSRAPAGELSLYASDPNGMVRARAAESLAKLQDSTSFQLQVRMLADHDREVRLRAAFGLGQLGMAEAEGPLLARLAEEGDLEVRLQVVAALGKIGEERALEQLVGLLRDPVPVVRGEAALAVAKMAMRDKETTPATPALMALLKDEDTEVRWRAAYALWRLEAPDASAELLRACGDRDARVRMFAVRALGVLGDSSAAGRIGDLLHSDPDWRIRVDAAGALGRVRLEYTIRYLDLADRNAHVRLTEIASLGHAAARSRRHGTLSGPLSNRLRDRLEGILLAGLTADSLDWEETVGALLAYARAFPDESIPMAQRFASHPHRRVRAGLATALSENGNPADVPVLLKLVEDPVTLVKIAALEALAKHDLPSAIPVYLETLKEGDSVLTALAVRSLCADTTGGRRYLPQMVAAVEKLPQPFDVEAAQMIFRSFGSLGDMRAVPTLEAALEIQDKVYAAEAANALKAITGRSYRERLPKATAPSFPWRYEEIRSLSRHKAVLSTAKGKIEIELFTDAAPLTVLTFARLARSGFYDGLRFHRVVPNFVIQGGDPRGDLWGSPGYSIRSEFNRKRYVRGAVGMASAGKDTEGCQFFITHSPQPHLDGRYTLFGRVVKGLDVVDRIRTDDQIDSIVID